MASPNEAGDRFDTITDHIHVLGHALTELQAEINDWPDAGHGLRCDTLGDQVHPDVIAATAAARVDLAREALRDVEGAVASAWAAAARLYVDDVPEQSERPELN